MTVFASVYCFCFLFYFLVDAILIVYNYNICCNMRMFNYFLLVKPFIFLYQRSPETYSFNRTLIRQSASASIDTDRSLPLFVVSSMARILMPLGGFHNSYARSINRKLSHIYSITCKTSIRHSLPITIIDFCPKMTVIHINVIVNMQVSQTICI